MAEGGFLDRARDRARDLLEHAPVAVVERDRLELLEAEAVERRVLQKELDVLGYSVYEYIGGRPQELKAQERRRLAQRARIVWKDDPQAGAATKLLNDFVFGRGVPRPKANDDQVQEELDAAWDDPDNQLVLTSLESQLALGTDLQLQSNLFLLIFEGDDGKVKLGLLDHDTVTNAVRDRDNRLRVLYFQATERRTAWDYANHREVPVDENGNRNRNVRQKVRYYAHWRNVELAKEEGTLADQAPPPDLLGDGLVYHIAVNRTSEMVFGVPEMARLLRWFSAFNTLMAARVDMAQAAAAFVMKRKSRGTAGQIERMAVRAMSRRSDLATQGPALAESGAGVPGPSRPGSVVDENESVEYTPFNLNSGSQGAMQDGQMIRSQISAATSFPQHYLGDASTANLATATALELPVLKAVETRQEVFEQLFRWFFDRVIERAVEAGRISPKLEPGEVEAPADSAADRAENEQYQLGGRSDVAESYEDQNVDEGDTDRDLSYEFSMPSPLRRMMIDVVNAVNIVAKTFDPNGTNMELSRSLLAIALGEALEVADPAAMVERIFPPGYADPALQQAPQPPTPAPEDAGGGSSDLPPQGENNPYGAPQRASAPENNPYVAEAARMMEADAQFSLVDGVALDALMALGDEPPGDPSSNGHG